MTLIFALSQLAKKWRADADAEERRLEQYGYGGEHDGEMLDEDIGVGFTQCAIRKACADELSIVLGEFTPTANVATTTPSSD